MKFPSIRICQLSKGILISLFLFGVQGALAVNQCSPLDDEMKQSNIDGNHAIFYRIEPGQFKMLWRGDETDVTLTKPFGMMATLVTQVIWRKIADLANNQVGTEYSIDPDPSHFKGDTRPVEQVSYNSIQIWIAALNELSQAGEPALADLIPGHAIGDIYRLPTEAEWEFVVRGRGQYNDVYYFGNEDVQFELGDYAWYWKNSDNQTHPVAQKKPLIIDGKAFYDMLGNVKEWTGDAFHSPYPGGVDPYVTGDLDSDRVYRSGSYGNAAERLRSDNRGGLLPIFSDRSMGFRLVKMIH